MFNSNGFSLKLIFMIRCEANLNFFICICKIVCKPTGNFAENLNLGKHVLPPEYDNNFMNHTCVYQIWYNDNF